MHTYTEKLTTFSRHVAHRVDVWFNRHSAPPWLLVMGTALLIGAAGGLGAVIFRRLIEAAQWLFYEFGGQLLGFLGENYIIIVPAIGGLIVGPMVYFFAREAKGHGVPEVMEAVALKSGRIRPRVAIIKSLASSVCIGSGGSVGREGPIVQIGSALGSTLGQLLNLSEQRVRNLVACGAAAGISATFNAPIAGALFALEIILGQFEAGYFGAVVISAVVADVVAHLFEGETRAFPVPIYDLVNPGELVLYAGLGVLAALVGVLYSKLIYRSEDLFENWKSLPEYFKPMVGGLLLGIMGVLSLQAGLSVDRPFGAFPQVFGVGYDTIEFSLVGQLALGTTLTLMLLKLVATALTLGSGGSGGVFAPSLFLGAMLGSAFGQVANMLLPAGTIAPSGAYALVGMAAVFAASAHAPATAILILFEMTGDYRIILPLMFATVVSLFISRAIEPESIYTTKLSRRGIRLQQGQDIDVLQMVRVDEVMTREVDTVPAPLSLDGLLAEFDRTRHHGFPVLDQQGDLVGVVTLTDVDRALQTPDQPMNTVDDIATKENLLVAYPDETMGTVLRRIGVRDIGRLPVVSRENPKRLLGVVRRHDIARAYNVALRVRVDRAARAMLEAPETGLRFVECTLHDTSPAVGKPICDLDLPCDCVLVSVRRVNTRLIPHGDTVLEVGDVVTAYASAADADTLVRHLRGSE